MTPCARCEAIAKCITPAFRLWAGEQGYEVHHNTDNAREIAYWRQYGRPNDVGQATPQLYVIDGTSVHGCMVVPGEAVGDYTIPPCDRWDARMLAELCRRLGVE